MISFLVFLSSIAALGCHGIKFIPKDSDCKWQVGNSSSTLDLSFASRAIMEQYSTEWLYQYSPCANRIECDDGTFIDNCMVTQMGDPSCVNCVSIWDDGKTQPTYNQTTHSYNFVYNDGIASRDCQDYVLQLNWQCDKSIGTYAILSVREDQSNKCHITMDVGARDLCTQQNESKPKKHKQQKRYILNDSNNQIL